MKSIRPDNFWFKQTNVWATPANPAITPSLYEGHQNEPMGAILRSGIAQPGFVD
jgi:hypothetical protein